MGTTAHVVVTAAREPDRLAEAARARVAELEARWSRFIPTSDVSRLNALASLPVVVAPETFALVQLAVEGWRMTGGRFDPTVLPALVAAGYDRSFDPWTAAPARTGLAGVCVVASRGWRAEVLAKAAFLAGPVDGTALVQQHGAAALLVADDGTARAAGAVEQFAA